MLSDPNILEVEYHKFSLIDRSLIILLWIFLHVNLYLHELDNLNDYAEFDSKISYIMFYMIFIWPVKYLW